MLYTSKVPANLGNFNQKCREIFVTDLAAVSRGKDGSNNPSKRFSMLLKEAAPNPPTYDKDGSPSRPLEFCPVKLKYSLKGNSIEVHLRDGVKYEYTLSEFSNEIGRFSYMDSQYIYTNIRALINASVPYYRIPFNDNIAIRIFWRTPDSETWR